MLIDYTEISSDALQGLAKEFVISQLADNQEMVDLPLWVDQTVDKIKKNELVIEFSQVDESVMIKPIDQIQAYDEDQTEG